MSTPTFRVPLVGKPLGAADRLACARGAGGSVSVGRAADGDAVTVTVDGDGLAATPLSDPGSDERVRTTTRAATAATTATSRAPPTSHGHFGRRGGVGVGQGGGGAP
ncbi:hypothetical protein Z045_10470 [Rhodococcus pyridinivorans KG-16]|uniref:Uncharacterized protein n=1 Tax=Rhodococcus pyridinivorans KG-16 TaxID=1441730 RepID=A0A0V9ULZ0_9NOCA|nr:hypothetical protein Z045_10470 [Rhodococcus pyridinivorans KG-16]